MSFPISAPPLEPQIRGHFYWALKGTLSLGYNTALALTLALLWSLAMAIVGIANSINPAYGELIQALSSVYPGYEGSGAAGDVAIGIAYGVVDGAFVGWVIASVYNFFLRRVGG